MQKKLTETQRQKRDERIRKLYGSGKYSQRSLAVKVGLSKSRVGEILY
jgi:transcriptional regulator with XRE-family HTH domain